MARAGGLRGQEKRKQLEAQRSTCHYGMQLSVESRGKEKAPKM